MDLNNNNKVKKEIEKFIKYLNENKSVKRKSNMKVTFNKVLKDFKHSAYHRLNELPEEIMIMRGEELSKFLSVMHEVFSNIVKGMKEDNSIMGAMDDATRLALIVELTICVETFDYLHNYANENPRVSFKKSLATIEDELLSNNKLNKNKRAKVEKIELIEEEDEDYNTDAAEEDEYYYSDRSRDFIKKLFNSRNSRADEESYNYLSSLSKKDRKSAMEKIEKIQNFQSGDRPIVFQIMDLPLQDSQKNLILKTYISLISSYHQENKLRTWFDSLMTIPFGKYKGIDLASIKPKDVKRFLDNLHITMDNAVYGHDEAKRYIIQMMGQQVRNPKSKGNVMGIWGPAGTGKTNLVKEGIAKAMDKPFIFISLGGATDASFLEGHSYTYEGSIYGRIVNGLITSQCMNPIIYFDELDKISKCPKGDEISNILVHLTDPVQNSHFRDKYFHGIDIDLSRATMIFSFNDPSNINPILMDRITNIETKYLLTSQKIHIAQNYMLPEIIKDVGLNNNDVYFDDETITHLINTYTNEGGVRKLKSLLYSLIREVNIANLTKTTIDNVKITFPFKMEQKYLKTLLKNKYEIEPEKIHSGASVGIINGLWASGDGGRGGIMPIQILWKPSKVPFEINATGNLQKVIKESTQVASTLAFNYLDKKSQTKLLKEMKECPRGIHIHCPDGAVPKDGPSAGTALTVAVYSMLTHKKIKNDIAITGEINLQGKVTAIGGLDNKLEGAKKAGIKLVLYPKENQKALDQIKERNPSLFSDDFKVIPIETVEEAFQYSLL